MRAHLYRPITNDQGDIQQNALVHVYKPGTRTLTDVPLYAAASGSATKPNPFVATNGVVDFYTDSPKRFRLGIRVGTDEQYLVNDMDALTPEIAGTSKFKMQTDRVLNVGQAQYAWSAIPGFRRGLMRRWALKTNGTSNWGIKVTSQPDGGGETMFEAYGIGSTTYQCSWPWFFENEMDAPLLYVGISDASRNPATVVTLTDMQAEVFLA